MEGTGTSRKKLGKRNEGRQWARSLTIHPLVRGPKQECRKKRISRQGKEGGEEGTFFLVLGGTASKILARNTDTIERERMATTFLREKKRGADLGVLDVPVTSVGRERTLHEHL